MKTIEQRIEEAADDLVYKIEVVAPSFHKETVKNSFIAGITSQLAQELKIEFAIGVLKELRQSNFDKGHSSPEITNKISELEKLKSQL